MPDNESLRSNTVSMFDRITETITIIYDSLDLFLMDEMVEEGGHDGCVCYA